MGEPGTKELLSLDELEAAGSFRTASGKSRKWSTPIARAFLNVPSFTS